MEERYVFLCEWYDINSSLIRTYQLTWFRVSKKIEMVNPHLISTLNFSKFNYKTQKPFLKKSTYPGLKEEHFYLGAILMLHSR